MRKENRDSKQDVFDLIRIYSNKEDTKRVAKTEMSQKNQTKMQTDLRFEDKKLYEQ